MGLLNTIVKQLSPLEDNLTSTVYSIFEKDAIKYIAYMQAIEETILDISLTRTPNQGLKPITIALVGAGRGGLLISIARAVLNLIKDNSKIRIGQILIVEKNLNCEYSLNYLMSSHPDIKSL